MNGRPSVDLPALDHLMGAYLHQDFDLFGETPMDAVDTFLRDEPAMATQLLEEIESVLAIIQSEEQLQELVTALGCEIWVDPELGYRGFLERIAQRASGGPAQAS